ncbi:MAG: thiamine diphosphokinase [Methylocystaceae bacterium]
MHCLLCLNGDYGEISKYRQIKAADLIIAADGGGNYMEALGLTPDLIIGDMDSVATDLIEIFATRGTEVRIFPPEKNYTDAQLALRAAVDRHADEITILGGIGDRLDHTWSTIMSTLPLAATGIKISFFHPHQSIYVMTRPISLVGSPGQIVSLLALTPVSGVTTHNLQYPLKAAELFPDKPYAVSNVMLKSEASIEITSGVLMVVHITG